MSVLLSGTILTSQVSASDGDGSAPNNVVFYVLDSGKGSDKFRVNSTTGVVTVGTGAVLDREADASFNLRLLAFDRGDPPRSSSTTLSVSSTVQVKGLPGTCSPLKVTFTCMRRTIPHVPGRVA